MNLCTATLTTLALLASAAAEAQPLRITRGGARPIQPAPQENFTGAVRVEALFEPVDPSHASGGVGVVRPRGPDRVALAPSRPDADRDGRHRPRSEMA